ncbi:YdcF family protein [Candidatus Shapirobacteria bacterium]|nr:YdcF family protein [Candidatus Shapirobacteria bacterium]
MFSSDTAIILGYGVLIKPNPNYEKYFLSALESIQSGNYQKIIFCGGCTNPNYPNLSEAQSIKKFFEETNLSLPELITEDNSLTTAQNLEFFKKHVSENFTIFCDSVRVPKIFYLCLSLYYPNLTEEQKLVILAETGHQLNFAQSITMSYQNFQVTGIPLSDTMELAAHQIFSSMIEMHFEDYPNLHQRFIDYRKKLWKIKNSDN